MAKAHSSNRSSSRSDRPQRSARSARGDSAPSSTWLTGIHSVREALRARRREIDRLWLRAGSRREDHQALAELAEQSGVRVEEVSEAEIERVAGTDVNPQGVALDAGPIPELSLSALVEWASGRRAGERGPGSRLVALDGVEDPQNVGAVARVAESAGVSGLILTDRRAPALTPTVSRASAGAIEWLPVARVGNLGRALADLQSQSYWIVAAALGGSRPLFEVEDRLLTGNLAIVLGAEGKGIRPSILDHADHLVQIPMRGEVASLNVSTAGAVILYDLLRRADSGVTSD